MLRQFIIVAGFLIISFGLKSELLTELADKSKNLDRHLLQFSNDGLVQYGLFIKAKNNQSKNVGLIVMAHGFHPDPPKYGKLPSGESKRPGDYYRGWVEAYGSAGASVFVPDYRGHNSSQGFSFTHQAKKVELPELYYAEDLVAGVLALENILGFEFRSIVLVGHSMGSPIAYWAASQLGGRVKLVSLWSSANYKLPEEAQSVPFVIHHGVGDKVTPITNSQYYINRDKALLLNQYTYQTDKHLIEGADFKLAIERDLKLINSIFRE
jgi:pimeloyl-ACP methyl ester carboxylesterase